MGEFTCQQCGLCCRKLIIEIGCLDVLREPRLASVARPIRPLADEGLKQPYRHSEPCGFDDDDEGDCEPAHEYPCHMLTIGKRCPMLGDDNKCTIYPTRPNVCVGFRPGGKQCRELREVAHECSEQTQKETRENHQQGAPRSSSSCPFGRPLGCHRTAWKSRTDAY
jgi:Fe-S-cluster containining protein